MALYQVCRDWEMNGRDDSDFYIVAYDSDKDQLERIEVGSTRYGGGRGYTGIVKLNEVPEDIMMQAEAALAQRLTGLILHAEERRVLHPKSVKAGDRVRLTETIRNRPREAVATPCLKCNGSGHWVNPRNASDKRQCFACSGSGSKVRTKAAKGAMVTYEAHTKATVKAMFENRSQYGTWDYGSSVILISENGIEFRAPLDKLRLDEEVPSEEECRQVAIKGAKNRNFYSTFATAFFSMV